MPMPRRQQREQKPPDAAQVTVCPSCEQNSLGPHCARHQSHTCTWLLCSNEQCRSFGIPGVRWCDMRKLPAA